MVEDDFEPRPYGVQGGGESGRAAACHEEIDHVRLARAVFSVLTRVRSSTAFRTENTSAVIYAV
jgi:hypothetical protein